MVDYSYIAGFFDGEGYINIQKKTPNSKSGSPYWLLISMANTNKQVLDEIQKLIGGTVLFHKGSQGKRFHYRLSLYNKQAYEFLISVREFLIVKQKEADIAISFQESLRPHGSRIPLNSEELLFREKCRVEIMSLHGNRINHKKIKLENNN